KLKLYKGNKEEIRSYMEDLAERRTSKQPLNFPSAGSTFKRPEGHFAGKLIQDAGLMGYRVGGACVSEKHAGFVVNDRNASAKDVRELIEQVKKKVYELSGVELEPEVKFIGEF
ncbi:MAG: UDP-N-acetylenolpyruvoylglucosamine reductase, partial [Clostridia bacterium]|nr:UDP-N-acetylenolpyruvoylglucosamine reductase [Clostridia bacterium]